MLHSLDYPFGKSAPCHHPGKRFVKYLIVSRAKVFQQAPVKSDPDRITKEDIITDILVKLSQEGGLFKRMSGGDDGEWVVVSKQDARKKVSQMFSDYKNKQRKEQEKRRQQILALEPSRVLERVLDDRDHKQHQVDCGEGTGDEIQSRDRVHVPLSLDKREVPTFAEFQNEEEKEPENEIILPEDDSILTELRDFSLQQGVEEREEEEKVNPCFSKASESINNDQSSHEMIDQLLTPSHHDHRKRERSIASRNSVEPDTKQLRAGSARSLAANFSVVEVDLMVRGNFDRSEIIDGASEDQDSFVDWISQTIGSISLRENTTISSLTSALLPRGKLSLSVWSYLSKKEKPGTGSPQGINLMIQLQDQISLLGEEVRTVGHITQGSQPTWAKMLQSQPEHCASALQHLEEILESGINEDGAVAERANEILDSVTRILSGFLGVPVQHLASDVIGMICLQPNVKILPAMSGKCISAVIGVMEFHASNAGIQAVTYRTLGSLAALSTENQSTIVLKKAIKNTLTGMNRFCADADVQRRGCYLLGSTAQGHRVHGHDLFNLRGVDAVLQAMRQHPDDATVQRNGCAAMGTTSLPQNAHEVGLTTVNLVLAAMLLHQYDEDVQCSACYCIRTLKYCINWTMPAVFDSMKRHFDVPSVQQRGNEAIGAICGRPDVIITSKMSNEAVGVIIAAMKRHSDILGVQHTAIATIGVLYARPQTTFAAEVSEECIHLVVAAIKAYSEEVHSVQYRGLKALAAIRRKYAQFPDTIKVKESSERVSVVIAAAKRLSGSGSARRVSTRFTTLSASIGSRSRNRSGVEHPVHQAIAASEAIEAITTMAHKHPFLPHDIFPREALKECFGVIIALMTSIAACVPVQASCLRSLKLLASMNNSDETEIAMGAGIERTLLAMHHLSEEVAVQRLGCEVLATLTDLHPSNQVLAATDPCFSVVPRAMSKHVFDSEVQISACKVIENIVGNSSGNSSGNPRSQSILAEAGCIESALNAMRTYEAREDQAVQWHACRALLALARGHNGNQELIASSAGIQDLLERTATMNQSAGFRRPFQSLGFLLPFPWAPSDEYD